MRRGKRKKAKGERGSGARRSPEEGEMGRKGGGHGRWEDGEGGRGEMERMCLTWPDDPCQRWITLGVWVGWGGERGDGVGKGIIAGSEVG